MSNQNKPADPIYRWRTLHLLAVLSLLTLATSGSAIAGESEVEEGQPAEVEHLCGVAASTNVFAIEVVSNGCTEAKDFVFVIERVAPSEVDVQVIRIVPDYCRGMERTEKLVFDHRSLGLEQYEIINVDNPFQVQCPERWLG